MHIPSFFRVKDMEEIKSFIQSHTFATVVTTMNEKPIATHIPVSFHQVGDSYVISGHMAIGNPQWKTFEEKEKVLIIFQGPHAYISSSWYEKEAVPTWNYQAVHVYGKAELLEKNGTGQGINLDAGDIRRPQRTAGVMGYVVGGTVREANERHCRLQNHYR